MGFCCLWVFAALGLILAVQARGEAAPRRPILLSTDCGADMDDQWALAHLALHPELRLVGVITSHSPILPAPSSETTARIARHLLDELRLRERPPITAGSPEPLASAGAPLPSPASALLLAESRAHSPADRLTVALIGHATDVASALLEDPTLADRITVIAMGFKDYARGGDEWNVLHDRIAWRVLLESGVPIAVGDQGVCVRELCHTAESARALLDDRGAAARLLKYLLIDFIDRHGDGALALTGKPDTWPIWDCVVVAHILRMTRSEVRPRPILRDDLSFDHAPVGGPVITWITSVDTRRYWADFGQRLGKRRAH